MFDFLKPKKRGVYDSEYFKNKVRISELEEKIKLNNQRAEIKRLEAKANPQKKKSGGNDFDNIMQGIGAFGRNSGTMFTPPPMRKGKGRNNNNDMFGGW